MVFWVMKMSYKMRKLSDYVMHMYDQVQIYIFW